MSPNSQEGKVLPNMRTHPKIESYRPLENPDRRTSIYRWLNGKVEDDNIGDVNLWRVHNDLYDFSAFVDRHPGGPEWLQLTRDQFHNQCCKFSKDHNSE